MNNNSYEKLPDHSYGIYEKLPDELYIIGDIHGDFYALKQALELTNCVEFEECITYNDNNDDGIVKINNNKIELTDGCNYYTSDLNENNKKKIKWKKNNKVCYIVFAGDLIDRCRSLKNKKCNYVIHDEDCDFQILKILIELDKQAYSYNKSRIIIVLGNHEIMNIEKKFNYLSIKALNNKKKRINNINTLIKNNIDNLNGIIRIKNYVICHGGINPRFIDKYYDDDEIPQNNYEFIKDYNIHIKKFLNDNEYEFKNFILDNESPFFDRTNGLNELELSNDECNDIFNINKNKLKIKNNTVLNKLKIIVAHCPQIINSDNLGINLTYCNNYPNKIWRIDVAMSRAFDSYIDFNLIVKKLKLILQKLNKNKNDKELNLDFILSFNNNIKNNVQILKITNIKEEIITGETSLKYFYNDVFKKNYYLMIKYLLQDIKYIHSYI